MKNPTLRFQILHKVKTPGPLRCTCFPHHLSPIRVSAHCASRSVLRHQAFNQDTGSVPNSVLRDAYHLRMLTLPSSTHVIFMSQKPEPVLHRQRHFGVCHTLLVPLVTRFSVSCARLATNTGLCTGSKLSAIAYHSKGLCFFKTRGLLLEEKTFAYVLWGCGIGERKALR